MTKRTPPFSPEVRERAVRLVLDQQGEHGSQYAAIRSVAAKIGCTAETLRGWLRQSERDLGAGAAGRPGVRAGPTTAEQERIRALEREVRELRQANEILRKASAYFAQAELDRRFRPRRPAAPAPRSPSSTRIARCMGSSRSASCCRSPRRRITPTLRGALTQASRQHGPRATQL
jgi:transposase